MTYQIEVNEKQLRMINCALEEYFRLRLGQFWGLADDISLLGVDMSPENPNHDKIFDSFITRRDAVREILDAAWRVASGHGRDLVTTENDTLICEDLWQVFRHQLWIDNENRVEWTVDAQEPYLMSSEPAAVISRKS